MLSKYNINVNCLSPGGIYNNKKPQNKKFIKKYSNRVPLDRMGNTENLYTGILFLASDQSNYVNGQNIIIDGGLSSW
jgi:NAD(P)-dependent dehydrogenase (short-subunit alcohol dehydrogenase family)